jgi:hypothetical protein
MRLIPAHLLFTFLLTIFGISGWAPPSAENKPTDNIILCGRGGDISQFIVDSLIPKNNIQVNYQAVEAYVVSYSIRDLITKGTA